MSCISATSSKREKDTADLIQELDSIRALNESLKTYLDNIRIFKKNIGDVHENCKELNKVNKQWIDFLNLSRKLNN